MPDDEWRLIPGLNKELVEIKCNEIPRMVDGQFFLALRYWKRFKKYGVLDPKTMTVAQVRVIDLFDDLMNRREAKE